MNQTYILFILLLLGGVFVYSYKKNKEVFKPVRIHAVNDIVELFPSTPYAISTRTNDAIAVAKKSLDAIVELPDDQRTYANTAHMLDLVCALSELAVLSNIIATLEMVHPDEQMRTAANETVQKINNFFIDNISKNKALYKAVKAYVEGNAQQEQLTDEQWYYLKDLIRDFERSGLNLPDAELNKVAELAKELAKLSQDFEVNIATDNRTITVKEDALLGLGQDFIKGLKRTDNGDYILGVDYPTYYYVIEHCSVADTRKKLFTLFHNRAYPANDRILKEVIAKRDEMAHLLGFKSFAHLNLDNSMVETPERAEQFLDDLIARVNKKVDQEFANLTQELPDGVKLSADGKMEPWDREYLKASYKKKKYTLDERVITDYFPMEKTIQGLLDIYHQFLSINFKEVAVCGLWHEDVRMVEVTDASGQLLGYFLLDLYPRDNKYSHACHITQIPSTFAPDDSKQVALSLLIMNFPKATADKPALLRRDDVKTFFHEFGHGIHALLGRTHVASLAGTSVKRDFVELPSQMLEEWLYDAAILKKVSSHYKTGQPLPDDLIAKIQQLKQFDSGDWTQRQAYLSKYSLACYGPGATKDPNQLTDQLYSRIRTHVALSPDDHHYAGFGHLMGYAASYYGYLWSKVYALDMFYEIKKHGLLNPEIGAKYVHDVIGKGGSEDPMDLLVAFLNRQPSSDAFFKDLGI